MSSWNLWPVLRVYTKQFGRNLIDAVSYHRVRPTLRQKVPLDPRATDVELFTQLELGDVWDDADLISVYRYLRRSAPVPNTWEDAMYKFDAELAARGLL